MLRAVCCGNDKARSRKLGILKEFRRCVRRVDGYADDAFNGIVERSCGSSIVFCR